MRNGTLWQVIRQSEDADSRSTRPVALLTLMTYVKGEKESNRPVCIENVIQGRHISALSAQEVQSMAIKTLPRAAGRWDDDTLPMHVQFGIYVFSVWKPVMFAPMRYFIRTHIAHKKTVLEVVTCRRCQSDRSALRDVFDRWYRKVTTMVRIIPETREIA